MNRVFWDTMLLIYLLESKGSFGASVKALLVRSHKRGDMLLTSYLALGEVLAGMKADAQMAKQISEALTAFGFQFVPFDGDAVDPFQFLRSGLKLRAPDALHLACAAASKADLFLTGDKELIRKKAHIPGIRFIADFENPPF